MEELRRRLAAHRPVCSSLENHYQFSRESRMGMLLDVFLSMVRGPAAVLFLSTLAHFLRFLPKLYTQSKTHAESHLFTVLLSVLMASCLSSIHHNSSDLSPSLVMLTLLRYLVFSTVAFTTGLQRSGPYNFHSLPDSF